MPAMRYSAPVLAALLTLLTASSAFAGPSITAGLDPVLELAPRAEFRGTTGDLGNAATPLILISRAGAAAQVGNVHARAVGQAWGRFTQSHDIGLYEGWVEYRDKGLSLRAGRQVIFWHELRIVGHRRWRPNALAHDALRLKVDRKRWHFDIAAGVPFDEERPFVMGIGGWKFGGKGQHRQGFVDLLFLREGSSWTGPGRHTVGVFGKVTQGTWGLRAEGYQQSGTLPSGGAVDAWLASLRLRKKVGNWGLSAYADLLSGDAAGAAKGSGAFNIVHGARHPYYGIMDIAYVKVGGAADGRGLYTAGAIADLQTGPWRVMAGVAHHHFASTDTIGAELDWLVRYKTGKYSSVVGGGGVLSRPAHTNVFGYVAFLLRLN